MNEYANINPTALIRRLVLWEEACKKSEFDHLIYEAAIEKYKIIEEVATATGHTSLEFFKIIYSDDNMLKYAKKYAQM